MTNIVPPTATAVSVAAIRSRNQMNRGTPDRELDDSIQGAS